TAVESDRLGPVEADEGNAVLEASALQAPFERDAVAALDLVGEQEGQEGGVVELLGAGQRQPLGQRRREGAQLEPLEELDQIGVDAHRSASVAAAWWSKALAGRAKRPSGRTRASSGGAGTPS